MREIAAGNENGRPDTEHRQVILTG